VHRSSRSSGGEHDLGPERDGIDGALAETVRGLEWLPGRVHAFVHGEAHEVMHHIRPHLLGERGLHRDQVSISGYWRRGRTEEGFRAWKSDLAKAEQQS
jgi:NADPH-dependent ferric siderophore reductase